MALVIALIREVNGPVEYLVVSSFYIQGSIKLAHLMNLMFVFLRKEGEESGMNC